ncbi:MAG: TetR/AcrR family transcriptional regulator [Myxococcota bacterium]
MNDVATPISPKEQQILKGAGEAFLHHGFEGASTDEIARRAGVSKATVYKYFPDKRALFRAYVTEACRVHSKRVFELPEETPLKEALAHIAHNFVLLLTSEEPMAVFRLVVAEGARFPELADAFYEAGPMLGHRRIRAVLQRAKDRAELAIDDVGLAASHFEQLCKTDLFLRHVFFQEKEAEPAEVDRIARAAVDVFLRAYSTVHAG